MENRTKISARVLSASAGWSFLGAILSFLSRPCCSLPFFLSLAGLGSSSLVLMLQPYWYVFFSAGLISFAISAYLTFRVRGAWFNKIFFILSLLAAILFFILPTL